MNIHADNCKMENSQKINIGLVDDDKLFVQLLIPLVEKSGLFNISFTAHSGNDFLQEWNKNYLELDIILLDLRMKNGNGLHVLRELQNSLRSLKVIVLSSFYRSSFMGQMLKLGASAFLSKMTSKEDLLYTMKTVFEKGHCFSEEQMDTLRNQLSSRTPKLYLPQKNGLTEREIEVLRLLCQQMSTQEIANELYISPKTVETHKSNLIVKSGVKNMAGLVIYAAQNKIVDPDELILLEV